MMAFMQKAAVPLILAAFLTAALFGFAGMTFGAGGQMQGDCPFSAESAPCQNSVSGVVHHLASWSAFLNVPVTIFAALALISMLTAAVVLVFLYQPLLFEPLPRLFSYAPTAPLRPQELIRWLSRTERSPSR